MGLRKHELGMSGMARSVEHILRYAFTTGSRALPPGGERLSKRASRRALGKLVGRHGSLREASNADELPLNWHVLLFKGSDGREDPLFWAAEPKSFGKPSGVCVVDSVEGTREERFHL